MITAAAEALQHLGKAAHNTAIRKRKMSSDQSGADELGQHSPSLSSLSVEGNSHQESDLHRFLGSAFSLPDPTLGAQGNRDMGSDAQGTTEAMPESSALKRPASPDNEHLQEQGGLQFSSSYATTSLRRTSDASSCADEAPVAKKQRVARKREMEKKRRVDINHQFGVLQETMKKIESECGGLLHHNYSPNNRIELLTRTIALVQRLYEENREKKAKIKTITNDLDASRKSTEQIAAELKEKVHTTSTNQAMVMVPMMMNQQSMQPAQLGMGSPGDSGLSNPTSHPPQANQLQMMMPTPDMIPMMQQAMQQFLLQQQQQQQKQVAQPTNHDSNDNNQAHGA